MTTLEDFGVDCGSCQDEDDESDQKILDEDSRPEPTESDDGDECEQCGESKVSVGERPPHGVELCASCWLAREGLSR